MIRKTPNADLRSFHTIFAQTGIITALLFMIAAVRIDFVAEESESHSVNIPDNIEGITLPPVSPPEIPPPPVKPPVPIPVPNNTILDDPIIEFPDFSDENPPVELPPIQSSDVNDEEFIHGFVEIMPEMKGGIQELYSRINYPGLANKTGVEGRVSVEFIVDEKGRVTQPEIIRGIGAGCDEEVLRVIKTMKFTPGIQNGRTVKVIMVQTVVFELRN